MNNDQLLNLLKQVLTLFGGIAAGIGAAHISAEQITTISNDLVVAVPALVSAGSLIWSVYAHWNMKKVPDKAIALELPKTVAPPTVGEKVLITGIGPAKVVA
jgi:hypothetical protein